jgi:hypothetical protein
MDDAHRGGEVGGLAQRPPRRLGRLGPTHRLNLPFATQASVLGPSQGVRR